MMSVPKQKYPEQEEQEEEEEEEAVKVPLPSACKVKLGKYQASCTNKVLLYQQIA